MMRRRAGDSADEIVLMMSSVTSSYSADGLRKQSQESAGSLHPDARRSDVVEEISSRKLQCNQQMLFGDSDSKTIRELQYPVARNPDARIEEGAKRSSRSDKSAAKQLTIYESWMSTAELNSNGESDKKPAKEKDARVLTAAGCGIGSVHAVVRSNLLVEPSEVEEGEM
ncbi:heat shock protein binding protein [Dorcoceras hygrometricum]|uniref:Heat shock protein binding protein n=1 Tax=Dorcoceras hygrometricum TaxID=472368 RepID=A0A2Z7C4V0_9LAMI|nr:heat shock protein binding protein [Dorcoceras hygrometricum]